MLGIPDPAAALTPAVRARNFVAGLRQRYGVSDPLPSFAESSDKEALQRCERELRPVLVYLHSDIHGDSAAFVRGTLTHPELVAFANENFICWAANVHEIDGCEAAARFSAAGFPFVGVFALAPGSTSTRPKYQRVCALEGYATGPELLAKLQAGSAAALTRLETMAAERASRVYERQLREEQDREYQEAEERDIARHREREAEEARAAEAALQREAEAHRAAEEQELAAAIALSQELHKESELAEARNRLAGHPEPPATGSREEVSALRFTLPSGARLQRRFLAQDTLQTVRDYLTVATHELGAPIHHFDLGTNYPRRTFAEGGDASMTLKAAGLFPQAMVFLSQSTAQLARDKEQREQEAAAAAGAGGGAGSGSAASGQGAAGAGAGAAPVSRGGPG